MDKVFVNFTNHPSTTWDEKQIEAARQYGEIVDVEFPAVDPEMTKDEVRNLADECVETILSHDPVAVLCQGEFTLCYDVLSKLKENQIMTCAACSKRTVAEINNKRVSEFRFVRFREYY